MTTGCYSICGHSATDATLAEWQKYAEWFQESIAPVVSDANLPYEQRKLNGTSRVCMRVGRGRGKTQAVILQAAEALIHGPTQNVIVVSYDDDVVESVRQHLQRMQPTIQMRSTRGRITVTVPESDRWKTMRVIRGDIPVPMFEGEFARPIDAGTLVFIDEPFYCKADLLTWLLNSNKESPPTVVAVGTPNPGPTDFSNKLAQDGADEWRIIGDCAVVA